jgi:DNA-binding transcriptional LysR family regulator
MVDQLASGQADLGISSLPVDNALLQATPIGQWSLSCVFPQGHAFEGKRSVAARDILQQSLVAFAPDTPQGRAIAQWCEQTGLQPQARIEVRSGQAACALAAGGAGVAVVDNLTARAWQGRGLGFRPVRSGPSFPAFAVRHARGAGSALEQAFLRHLQAQFQRLRREGGAA